MLPYSDSAAVQSLFYVLGQQFPLKHSSLHILKTLPNYETKSLSDWNKCTLEDNGT